MAGSKPNATSSAFEAHDHGACESHSLEAVERTCEEKGLRLTPIRRRVLEHLLTAHRALGAYDLLDLLGKEGNPQKPPAVYRALSFLVENGFAHRLEHRNAYIGCTDPTSSHLATVLYCRSCERVAEARIDESDDPAVVQAARKLGFTIERTVIEAEGICANCQSQEPG